MNFSKMDRRVTLLKYEQTTGELGGAGESWIEGPEFWADRRDQPGREILAAGQTVAQGGALFFIRWRDDISPKDRLRCDGLEYDIIAPPREIGRRDGLEITARARVG